MPIVPRFVTVCSSTGHAVYTISLLTRVHSSCGLLQVSVHTIKRLYHMCFLHHSIKTASLCNKLCVLYIYIPNESPSLHPPSSRGALGPTPATVNPLRLNGPPNGQYNGFLTNGFSPTAKHTMEHCTSQWLLYCK
jgi:hypothetical protein